ncbi:MAG: DUF499 domain-containing protein [Caldilineaceae bacterium]|nr:DUF499 domain-containing protein [Caldilineaceae bacterium]
MATTNRERIGKMLELLQAGLKPFVEREMKAEYKQAWLKQAAYSLRDFDERDPHFDAHALLMVLWEHWNPVFSKTLGHAERSLVSELRNARNDWAHQKPFSSDDTYRALDSAARLLDAISAPEAKEVERQKLEVLRLRFEEQNRSEQRRAAVTPVEGRPAGGLRPWRELITPHPDVASGRYQQAEFAADLDAVHAGDATVSAEYRDPEEFFRRTYLTEGLRDLLTTALRRLGGSGGDPVVELKTNFGGGKTHSMIALYHLFSGVSAAKLAGVEGLLRELGLDQAPAAKRAVLVGTRLAPGQPHTKPDGTVVRTMWGELAHQLGGQDGYALVAGSDAHGTNPGIANLRELFVRFGPSLILIDEWVAFMRQLYTRADLPAGSFDANLSFAQSLTEAVKQAPGTLLVASLPASDIEIGGEGGRQALVRLQNTFGRIEATWRPASAEESFEIVRRRLFQPIAEPRAFAARDAVIAGFVQMYRDSPQDFPNSAREAGYGERMKAAYPIHPELFDRLYTDWSSLERFQRTRGVLRLMAAVIHELWERQDANLLIMPASIPIDAPAVQKELTRYLEDPWVPVIERDVDGPSSLPLRLDRENPNLGRTSACRRVARTIYMGSAPIAKAKNPGIDERSVKLGAVQPGEPVATFGDALRRLTDNATHLYVNQSRYWYSIQPSVARLAQERAVSLDEIDVWEELKRRLRADRNKGDFAAVHAAPGSSADVADEAAARLVILGPEYRHVRKGLATPAYQQCMKVLKERGSSPRLYQNMLVFLAPDDTRLRELEEALRQYLAWGSIVGETAILNLDTFQSSQAKSKWESADQTVAARILETYIWLLAPAQADPQDPSTLVLEETRLPGQEGLAAQASKRLVSEEALLVRWSGLRLHMALDQYHLWQGVDHIGLQQLWEYFARYPYLPRLRDENVLLGAVQDGIGQTTWQEFFAYASAYDTARSRYQGLKAGEMGSVVLDKLSVLVRPEAAVRQMEADRVITRPGSGPIPGGADDGNIRGSSKSGEREGGDVGGTVVIAARQAQRFYATVDLSHLTVASDASKIAEHVVQHLSSLPTARVRLTLEIEVELPDGVSEQVKRTVTENAATLKFRSAEFDEA